MLPLVITQLGLSIADNRLLSNIDLEIGTDGISIIMGHNGAGKSLLLRCMHGLLKPTTGKVMWAGKNAAHSDSRKKQAMVFQKPLMFNRSVAANINYVLNLRGKPKHLCKTYLASAGLADKASQPARSLSGGEQQRLAIARALATDPQALLFDEPTANLDPNATRKIENQIVAASHQSIKIIMVTHDVAQARRLASEVIFLHRGSLAEQTNAEHFFNQPHSPEAQDYLSSYLGSSWAGESVARPAINSQDNYD